MFGRAWAPRLRANRSSADDFDVVSLWFWFRCFIGVSSHLYSHFLGGDVDWQQMRVSYGAPGSMLEQEWIGLHFPYLGWHDPPVGVNQKRTRSHQIVTFNVDTISEEILDRYSYTPVREFQAGCKDWWKENARRHVSNILSNEPYASKGLVVPHIISVHYSHDMPLVPLYSPCYHHVSHWFCYGFLSCDMQTNQTNKLRTVY